jgi:flagellar hook protein FlgE
MSFSQGISGLSAAAANLDTIGNNISNSGTVGFKSAGVTFQDVYAGSSIGLGTSVGGIVQNFGQGSVQTSSRPLDLAITDGDGFFRLTSPSGEVVYSRNGQFTADKNGFIVNAAGMQLTGHAPSANGGVSGGAPTPLQLPSGAMVPNPTSQIVSQFNIDARSSVPGTTPFDPTDSRTYNYSNSVTVFDSLGNPHELASFFVKTGSNAWDVYATADGLRVPALPVAPAAQATVGSLVFDSNGNIDPTAPAPASATMNIAGLSFGNGSSPMNIAINLSGTTQFGATNVVNKLTQDGYTSGTLTSFAVNDDGTITGKYSNEQTKLLGQVVLTSFANPNGLQSMGNNAWSETAASGQPLTGDPGAGTKQGALKAGAVESSNVDLTVELVNLIVAQRSYQANTQTLKTQDQVMQALINMR